MSSHLCFYVFFSAPLDQELVSLSAFFAALDQELVQDRNNEELDGVSSDSASAT